MNITKKIVNNLNKQRRTGDFCDIQLLLGKQRVFIHSAVICPFSAFIKTEFFISKCKISEKNTSHNPIVKIKLNTGTENCRQCLNKLISFLYGKKIPLISGHELHLLNYCNSLKIVEKLVNSLMKSPKSIMKIDNKVMTVDRTPNLEDIQINNDLIDPEMHNEHSQSSLEIINSSENFDNTEELRNPSGTHHKLKCDNLVNLPTGKTQNCLECDFKCYKSTDLLIHLKNSKHDGKICSLCWTEVKSSIELKKHIMQHDDPKLFFCVHCHIRFQTRTLLAQHIPTHLSVRHFSCFQCDKKFKSKHALNCHNATHSKERKHLCDECGFSTLHARMLRAHKLIHSGKLFECPFPDCLHKSTLKQNMDQHVNTHNKTRPFVCELCGHKFSQQKSLKRHSLIHDNERISNLCPHCPFKTRRIDNLKAHISRLHITDISSKIIE